MFDETPQWLRVRFPGGSEEAERESSKLFVVQRQYAALLKLKAAGLAQQDCFLYVHVPCSHQLRVSENETGENIANVLESTSLLPRPPQLSQLLSSFRCVWRVSEADEAPANAKAERLHQAAEGFLFQRLRVNCTAHKCHSAASKTFALDTYVPVLSGIIHCYKTFWDRRFLQTFKKCLQNHISSHLVFKQVTTSKQSWAATVYKNHVLELFLPHKDKPKVRARGHLLAQVLLNDDWRWGQPTHLCSGCCVDRESAVTKVQFHLGKLCRHLKVSMLCKGNWANWPLHLNFFGYLAHCHNMLPSVLSQALSTFSVNNPLALQVVEPGDGADEDGAGADNADALDDVAHHRKLRAASARIASDFATTAWPQNLWRLRACLGPQIRLMTKLLQADSYAMELRDLGEMLTQGQRHFNVVRLAGADDTHRFMLETMETLFSETLWHHMPPTEQHQSELLRASGRAAAIVWQLVSHKWSLMPFQLFRLLRTPSMDLAERLIATRACQQDSFTRHVFELFPTAAALLSRECLEVLGGAAYLIHGSTFSTETCHSRNQRYAKKRINTTIMEPHTLAMSHTAVASARWLHPEYLRVLAALEEKQRLAAKRKAEHQLGDDAASPQPRRKKRGGGGPWRAFLHEHCAGQRLPTTALNMQTLRDQYQALPDIEKDRLRRLGLSGALTWASFCQLLP